VTRLSASRTTAAAAASGIPQDSRRRSGRAGRRRKRTFSGSAIIGPCRDGQRRQRPRKASCTMSSAVGWSPVIRKASFFKARAWVW
jgi:hypothetical protein